MIPSPKIKRLFWRDFLTNSRLGPEEFRTKFWECSSDHQDDHISKNHHFPLLVKQVNLTNDVTKKAVRDSLKPLRKTEGQDSNVKGAAKKLLKTGSPTRHFGQTKFLVKKSLPKLIRKKMWSEITSWIGWKSHTPTPLNHQVLPETLVSHYAIRRCPGKRPHERTQEAPSSPAPVWIPDWNGGGEVGGSQGLFGRKELTKTGFHFRWLNTCQEYLVYIYNIYEHNIHVYSYLYRALQNPHDHHPVGFNDLAGPFIFKSWCHSRLAGKISEKKCLFLHSFQDSKKRDVVTFIHLSIHHYRLQTLRFFGRNQCLSEALLAKARKG